MTHLLNRTLFALFFAVFASLACAEEKAPRILTGTQGAAPWRIDVPANWNGKLIVFFHGNEREPVTYDEAPYAGGGRRLILERGYALVQSGYARADWNIEDGYRDSEWVRKYFSYVFGKPKQTFAVGQSMGGLSAAYALEKTDTPYDGGLAIAGTLGGGDGLFQVEFANLAAFDYYVPGLLGNIASVPAGTVVDDAYVERVDAALKAKPDAVKALCALIGVSAQELPMTIAGDFDFIRRLEKFSGGVAVGNEAWIYNGSGDDVALNAGVKRYAASPHAQDFLRRNYTPTGRLQKPLLELVSVRDPLVPASSILNYAQAVARADRSDRFVVQIGSREGHLSFTPDEINRAFSALQDWVDKGTRPASGLHLAEPAAAAEPMPPHQTFTMQSEALKEVRKLNVYLPPDYDAKSVDGYDLLVMPDGGEAEDFPHVANAIHAALRQHAMRPVILVGIENTERRRDMTGPTTVDSDNKIAVHVGGSAAFRQFIRDELLPEIRHRYRVGKTSGIIGESLAGLFVMETAFVEPGLFDRYVALSPSLWWNGGALVNNSAQSLKKEYGRPTLLFFASAGDDDNAAPMQKLVEVFKTAAPKNLTWTYEARADLRHDNIYLGLQDKALRAAFPPTNP